MYYKYFPKQIQSATRSLSFNNLASSVRQRLIISTHCNKTCIRKMRSLRRLQSEVYYYHSSISFPQKISLLIQELSVDGWQWVDLHFHLLSCSRMLFYELEQWDRHESVERISSFWPDSEWTALSSVDTSKLQPVGTRSAGQNVIHHGSKTQSEKITK